MAKALETLDSLLGALADEIGRRREEISQEIEDLKTRKFQYLKQIRDLRRHLDEADEAINQLQGELSELEKQRPAREAQVILDYIGKCARDEAWNSSLAGDVEKLRRRIRYLEELIEDAEDPDEEQMFAEKLRVAKQKMEKLGKQRRDILRIQLPFAFRDGTLWILVPLSPERLERASEVAGGGKDDLGYAFLYALAATLHRFAKEMGMEPSEIEYETLGDIGVIAYDLEGVEPEDVKNFLQIVWEDTSTGVPHLGDHLDIRFWPVSERTWSKLMEVLQ